jgi:hypothetical protein
MLFQMDVEFFVRGAQRGQFASARELALPDFGFAPRFTLCAEQSSPGTTAGRQFPRFAKRNFWGAG